MACFGASLTMVFATKARRQAAERRVVQNMRLLAFCSAKHARVVLHLPSQQLGGFCAQPLRLRQPARLTTR